MDKNLSTKLEVFVSCESLPSHDTFSASDPMCVLFLKNPVTGEYSELDRSEAIKNKANPKFGKRFVVEYHFEENQELRFQLYDVDSASYNLDAHDFIGEADIVLGELATAPGQNLTKSLSKRGQPLRQATITVRCEEIHETRDILSFQVQGKGLDKMDLFGKSDPYLEIHRDREDGSDVMVHKTEVCMKTLNPQWKPFNVLVRQLCNGDLLRTLTIKCYDWDKNSQPDLIGSFTTSAKEILDSVGKEFKLMRISKKKKKPKLRGKIIFSRARLIKRPSFMEFLRGGMQIGLMVAIDFTGSNGDPRDQRSLHYRSNNMNQYQQVINSIGNIIMPYDHDHQVPVWGFGGKVAGRVSHCFPLTFDQRNVEVNGVAGVMGAYNNAFNYVLLSGPTYFQEILSTAEAIAATPYQGSHQHYSILLIITDGIINDMKQTIDRLVSASDKPLSVIIVGVGNADFSSMERLDGDDVHLVNSDGKRAKRDIVQFVPMRDFANKHISALAKEVLHEVPGQVTSFAALHNLLPNPPQVHQQQPQAHQQAAPAAYADAPPAYGA